MAIEVQQLLQSGETFFRFLEPSRELFQGNLTVRSRLAVLSFLSRRPAYWEPAVCLVGFTQREELDPDAVLLRVDARAVAESPEVRDAVIAEYLAYCGEQPGLFTPLEMFVPALYGIRLAQGGLRVGRLEMSVVDDCRAMYPDDRKKFLECVHSHLGAVL